MTPPNPSAELPAGLTIKGKTPHVSQTAAYKPTRWFLHDNCDDESAYIDAAGNWSAMPAYYDTPEAAATFAILRADLPEIDGRKQKIVPLGSVDGLCYALEPFGGGDGKTWPTAREAYLAATADQAKLELPAGRIMWDGALATALNCIEHQKRFNVFRGAQVGVIVKDMSPYFSIGEFVLVSGNDGKECTVEKPMTPDELARQRERGSLLSTVFTTISFPSSAVKCEAANLAATAAARPAGETPPNSFWSNHVVPPPAAPSEPAGVELPDGPGVWHKPHREGSWWLIEFVNGKLHHGFRVQADGSTDDGVPADELPRGHWHRAQPSDGRSEVQNPLRGPLEMVKLLAKDVQAQLSAAQTQLAHERERAERLEFEFRDLAQNLLTDGPGDPLAKEIASWSVKQCVDRITAGWEHISAERDRLREGLQPLHKCRCIARIHNMAPGRDWWLGELTEKHPDWPNETHCLHIKTPLKDVVLLCNMGDLQGLTVLCNIPFPVVNERWKERMEAGYRRAAMPDLNEVVDKMLAPQATPAESEASRD